MIQTLLDLQENITVVYKDGVPSYCNLSFLSLVGCKDLDDFLDTHKDIVDIFVSKDGYFSHESCKSFWLDCIEKEYQQDRKVIIKDFKTNKEKVFFITLNRQDDISLIQLTEITNLEKHYKLLQDVSYALEKANEIELVKRFQLEKEAIEQERILIQQTKMAELGEMIGVITHQWKQPLNILSIKTQELVMLYENKTLDDEYIKSFENITQKQIHFMSKTIDDFRNFFNPHKHKEDFYIQQAIKDVICILDYQLGKNDIRLSINGDNGKIFGVENEFKQVILNILNNAKEQVFSIIKNDFNFVGFIDIVVTNKDGFFIVEISDNAGGIKTEIIDNIFEAHFTTKEKSGGSGIGLNIGKMIIEKNFGGKLSVENIKNGAKFIIVIKESNG